MPGRPPLTHTRTRRRFFGSDVHRPAAATLTGALLLAGCGATPVDVVVPSAEPEASRICRSLHRDLPDVVDGRREVATRPASSLTAAWGRPPVVLRCGVTPPDGLRPESEILEVNGVEWFLHEPGDGYVFTTVRRVAHVELKVPSSVARAEATAPLVDLAAAIGRHVPVAEARS